MTLAGLIRRATVLGFDAAAAERFWSRVDIQPGCGACWEWTRARHTQGYGAARHEGRGYPAHRLAYLLAIGPVPTGEIVCHRCANPPCCRPSHLFAGCRCWNVPHRPGDGYIYTFQGPNARPQYRRTGVALPDGRIGPLARLNA